jgi:hypothetical protein
MSIVVDPERPKRSRSRGVARPSVREVCLVGMDAARSCWALGDRVTWSGRAYRVTAAHPRAGELDGAPRYVHLTAADAD